MVVYAEMCSRLLRTSITAGPSVASAACSAGPASCAALTVNPAAPNAWASAAKSGLTSPVAFSRPAADHGIAVGGAAWSST